MSLITGPVPLERAGDAHGGKARTLGLLRAAGFPVPSGWALAAADSSDPASVAALARVVADHAGGDASPGWAVRSSSPHEDQAHESAAGRYTSVLGVRGQGALVDAIARCVDSGGGEPIGVVVQEMVAADAAGVAFTVNPVTGADEVVVNAVAGLGDQLGSGEATPEEWSVSGGRAVRRSGDEPVLDDASAKMVADWATRVARHLGAPQDIEWAIADGRFHLLQARPVTTIDEQVPVPVVVPKGYWSRDPGHARLPRTPLTWSFNEVEAVEAFAELSGALATLAGREIGGWIYMTVEPVGAPPPGDRPAPVPPAWLMPILLLLSKDARRRMRAARRAMREDLAGRLIAAWREEVKPDLEARIAALRDTDRAMLTEAELADHLDATAALAREGFIRHFRIGIPYQFGTADLVFFCRDRLGWSEEETLELVAGLSDASSEPARELRRLGALDAADPAFDEALARFQRVYGCRALDLELAEPTLAESPEILRATLVSLRDREYDPEEEAAELAARRRVAADRARSALPVRLRDHFDAILERAESAYPLRDENVFLTVDAPYALLRYGALEAGRRLVRRGAIAAAEDVFFLEWEELVAAVRGADADLRGRIRTRRGQHAWAIAHPGPLTYGTPPGKTPSFRALPRSVRFPTEAMSWIGSRIVAVEESTRPVPVEGEPLIGIPASPGRYTGPARIVHDERGFDRIRPGDVLVCPGTRPSWSVIFPSLGAVVADSGGSLSHPAIIAREHRLPAVVATMHGTSVIRDGQLVTVDGSAGRVVLHPT